LRGPGSGAQLESDHARDVLDIDSFSVDDARLVLEALRGVDRWLFEDAMRRLEPLDRRRCLPAVDPEEVDICGGRAPITGSSRFATSSPMTSRSTIVTAAADPKEAV